MYITDNSLLSSSPRPMHAEAFESEPDPMSLKRKRGLEIEDAKTYAYFWPLYHAKSNCH